MRTQPQRPAFCRHQFNALIGAKFPLLFAITGLLLSDRAAEVALHLTGNISHHDGEKIHPVGIGQRFDLLEIATYHLHPCYRLQADPVQFEHAEQRRTCEQPSKLEEAKIQDRDDALALPPCQWRAQTQSSDLWNVYHIVEKVLSTRCHAPSFDG